MKIEQCTMDTYDNVYDIGVTVEPIEDDDYKTYPDDENYYKFCLEILKKVDVVEKSGGSLIVNWNELVNNNMEKFRAFTEKHWREDCQYEDDNDEFVYQWINEIHLYLAGYTNEETYGEFVDLLNTIEH
jgi:hypothetical protein